MPKFSIITPVYNTAEYLDECLSSVLTNSFNDFELICVNDASTDASLDILNKRSKKDKRVKVYSLDKNFGPGSARNFGMAKSAGEYIVFVDSDDTIEQDYLSKIFTKYSEWECDCIVIGKKFLNPYLGYQSLLPTWGISVSRCMLDQHSSIRFPAIRPCEDGIFSHKMLRLSKKVGFCADAKYNYRVRQGSSERTLTPEYMIVQIPNWFKILEDFYDEYSLWERDQIKLLNFIASELFGRFRHACDFDEEQKLMLFDLMHAFFERHNLHQNAEPEIFGDEFVKFFNSATYEEYVSQCSPYSSRGKSCHAA